MKLFMDLDYIKQEAEREKCGKEDLKEDGEIDKAQFKMNIVKGNEEERKAETENFSDLLWKQTKKNIKK